RACTSWRGRNGRAAATTPATRKRKGRPAAATNRPPEHWPFRPAPLVAKHEVHAHAAHFDDVAVIQAQRPRNRRPVDGRDLVAGAHVVSVIAAIDSRGRPRLAPAPHLYGG